MRSASYTAGVSISAVAKGQTETPPKKAVDAAGLISHKHAPRARSSAGEHSLHTREVAGSIPAAPTTPITVNVCRVTLFAEC
jgi:hypothetical protein